MGEVRLFEGTIAAPTFSRLAVIRAPEGLSRPTSAIGPPEVRNPAWRDSAKGSVIEGASDSWRWRSDGGAESAIEIERTLRGF